MKLRNVILAAAGAAIGFTGSAVAHSDIELTVVDNRIVTGIGRVADNAYEGPARVYESWINGPDHLTFPNGTNDPGLNSDIGVFPYPSKVGFNILDSLLKWNGSGFDIASETMTITGGAEPFTSSTGFVAGYGLTVRGESTGHPAQTGRVHSHYQFWLNDAPVTLDGIYLLQFEVFNSDTPDPWDTSLPFWIVFGQSNVTEAQLDYVVDWVDSNIVPEPASLGLLAAGGLLLLRRRRA